MEKCDCLNYCADDPLVRTRKVMPCPQLIDQHHEEALRMQRLMDGKAMLEKRLSKRDLAAITKLFPELA